VGTWVLSLGLRWLGCDAEHASFGKVKIAWSYTFISLLSFASSCGGAYITFTIYYYHETTCMDRYLS
jgi:hypothetical protein